MSFMDIFIVECDFNDRYRNNIKIISFVIQLNFINFEGIALSIHAMFFLGGETLRSYVTLLKGCSDIIVIQEIDRVLIHTSTIM